MQVEPRSKLGQFVSDGVEGEDGVSLLLLSSQDGPTLLPFLARCLLTGIWEVGIGLRDCLPLPLLVYERGLGRLAAATRLYRPLHIDADESIEVAGPLCFLHLCIAYLEYASLSRGGFLKAPLHVGSHFLRGGDMLVLRDVRGFLLAPISQLSMRLAGVPWYFAGAEPCFSHLPFVACLAFDLRPTLVCEQSSVLDDL